MKKITSLILALVMAMSLTVTALAATTTPVVIDDLSNAPDVTNIEVPADYKNTVTDDNAGEIPTVYYVYMTWEVDSQLQYTVGTDSYKWKVYSDETGTIEAVADKSTKPASAGYVVDGKWKGTATVNVTVENWSNKDVKVSYTFAGIEGLEFNQDNWGLTTASKTIATKANYKSTDLVKAANVNNGNLNLTINAEDITGAITQSVTSIGTLTVTVDKVS